MTVKQVMTQMDSLEYSQWMAFEKVYGELGGQRYNEEILAALHEQLQQLSWLTSQANFATEEHPEGPIKPPQRYPRVGDDREPKVEEVDYSEEWLPPLRGDARCPEDCTCKGGTSKKSPYHF